ncbi:MAG: YncE family protein [Gemmatimonadetes bacterium]|nr:YncE family protein [Gemmatimonadota bacterium]
MKRIFVTAAVAALAAGGCATSSGGQLPDPAAPPPGTLAYVANEASGVVSVVDVRDGSVEVVDLKAMGYGETPKPHHVVVEPDGSHWYVSLIAADRVLKMDRANRVVDSVVFERPGLMALGAGDGLFVGRSMAAVNPPQRIGWIQRSTMDLEEVEVFVPRPHAIATDPSGRWVFTGSLAENTLVALDTGSGRAEITRLDDAMGHMAHAFVDYAVSPDGRTLVATAEHTSKLLVFDLSGLPALRLVTTLDVGARPWHPAFTPDGSEVWFGNLGADQVTVVDASTWTVAAVVEGRGLAQPHGIAISPEGDRVYVSSRNEFGRYAARGPYGPTAGTLVVIDVDARAILEIIDIPHWGAGMGMAGGS